MAYVTAAGIFTSEYYNYVSSVIQYCPLSLSFGRVCTAAQIIYRRSSHRLKSRLSKVPVKEKPVSYEPYQEVTGRVGSKGVIICLILRSKIEMPNILRPDHRFWVMNWHISIDTH